MGGRLNTRRRRRDGVFGARKGNFDGSNRNRTLADFTFPLPYRTLVLLPESILTTLLGPLIADTMNTLSHTFVLSLFPRFLSLLPLLEIDEALYVIGYYGCSSPYHSRQSD